MGTIWDIDHRSPDEEIEKWTNGREIKKVELIGVSSDLASI